jgi:hypothetical protein
VSAYGAIYAGLLRAGVPATNANELIAELSSEVLREAAVSGSAAGGESKGGGGLSARGELFRRVAGAFVNESKANALIDAAIAEALTAAADDLHDMWRQTENAQQAGGIALAMHRIRDLAMAASPSSTAGDESKGGAR